MPAKVEISYKTIVFTVFFLILLWLLVQIRDTILLVFIAFILMSALKPLVERLEKWCLPRPLAILLVSLSFLSLLVYTAGTIIPPLVSETIHFFQSLPGLLKPVLPFVQIDSQLISQQVTPLGENLLKVTVGVFSNIISVFSVLVISFYLLIERQQLEPVLESFMGQKSAGAVVVVLKRLEDRLGAWVRGQLTLMIFIGVAIYLGLSLLGSSFVLPLAILAGTLEIIPVIGPILSAIPAVLIALTYSPVLALVTAGLYFIIQQLEAHVVIPQVMRKAVGIPPLVTIVALMIGGKLAGLSGAILAVPLFLTIETIFSEYMKFRESTEARKPDSVSPPAEASAKAGR